MQEIKIPFHHIGDKIKLNSYRPLCFNKAGRNAIQKYSFPPYIDSSCRREPDFENENPSISALCRSSKFAPTLEIGDIILYMTKKGKYQPEKEKHHRLVAILQVEEIYPSHEIGRDAYESLNLRIPSNCMVIGNPPHELNHTGGISKPFSSLSEWDACYRERSENYPCFIRTKKIYLNLDNPAPIFDDDLKRIFGNIPGTRNPKTISEEELIQMARLAGIELIFEQKQI